MGSSDNATSARLQTLEERLSFQQRQLDQFHEAVLEQQREIDELRRQLGRCRAVIDVLHSRDDDLPHEKPPHY